MNLGLLLLVVLILMIVGLPQFSGSWHNMHYGPSGLGLLIVIILVIVLLGRG